MEQKKITFEEKHLDNLANAINLYLIPAIQKLPKPEEESKSQNKGA